LATALERINAIKQKLAAITFKVPYLSMDWGKWSKWSPLESMGKVFEFGWKEIKPFGFLAGSSSEGAVTLKPGMSGAAGESGKDNTPSIDKQQARSLA